MEEIKFTASLHTHVRSLYDAHIDEQKLCDRIKELGGLGCAITDHGVLSSIEDYRRVFAANDLKMIPGCELYIDGGILGRQHLVLLAVNDHGYSGISRIVTESNKTLQGDMPVIHKDTLFNIMKDYQGDIIALSACMQGVLCSVLLGNKSVLEKIEKVRAKQEGYISPSDNRAADARRIVEEAQAAYEISVQKKDATKRCAEMKFAAREKALVKLEKNGDESASRIRAEIEADKVAAKEAAERLPIVTEAVKKQKAALSAAEKQLKELEASAGKYLEYEESILALEKEIKTDELLMEEAERVAKEYAEAFGKDCFYIELQYHSIPEEAECFPKAAILAQRLGLPVVATNDVHILTASEDERLKRQLMRSLRFGKDFEEEHVGDSELYLKDDAELSAALLKILPPATVKEAIENIAVIFNRCNVAFETEKHYPKFSKTGNADDILDAEIKKGIAVRFPKGIDKTHEDRLQYELGIIKSMGYSDYHLIVKDFLEYGHLLGALPAEEVENAPLSINGLKEYIKTKGYKNYGMMTGPGRGSAVGSLACYILGITALDPLKYGLLFERFLNPERISMPDIDSDLGKTIRGKVIRYVQKKYGENAVCGIMTTTFLAPKGAIKTAAKYYGLKVYGEPMTALGNTLAAYTPDVPGTAFSSIVNDAGDIDSAGTKTLLEYIQSKAGHDKDAQEIIRWATIMEGTFTAYGAHAAGIVISDNGDVSEYIPLRMNTTLGMLTTQCDMVEVEDNGLLKFDFLGLKTLDVITDTLRYIEADYGKIIDPLKIDLEDKDVYGKIMSQGRTDSVFQFESDGMKAMLKRFKPENFEDLIILVSMFRPGPKYCWGFSVNPITQGCAA